MHRGSELLWAGLKVCTCFLSYFTFLWCSTTTEKFSDVPCLNQTPIILNNDKNILTTNGLVLSVDMNVPFGPLETKVFICTRNDCLTLSFRRRRHDSQHLTCGNVAFFTVQVTICRFSQMSDFSINFRLTRISLLLLVLACTLR